MTPAESELNAQHRAELLRIMADHPDLVEALAKEQGCSERAVYRVSEGQVPGRWWVPRLIGEHAGVAAFAAVSGANALGYVVVAPPVASEAQGRDLAMQALQLGGNVAEVQRLVLLALSPDSPGGARVVGPEELAIRQAVAVLKRAAVALEQVLDGHTNLRPLREGNGR